MNYNKGEPVTGWTNKTRKKFFPYILTKGLKQVVRKDTLTVTVSGQLDL